MEQLHLQRTKSDYRSHTSDISAKSSRCSSRSNSNKHKLMLQQKEAAIKVELSFLNEKQRLTREKLRQEQEEENLRLKKELAHYQAQFNVCSELGHNVDEMSLSELPRESPTESVIRYFNSLAADHHTTDLLIPPAENSQYFISPSFNCDPFPEEVRTVQTSTRLYTTITTTTPLISPAHYTVSKVNSSQRAHQDNNFTRSLVYLMLKQAQLMYLVISTAQLLIQT